VLNGVVTLGETMALMSSNRVGPLKHSSSLSLGIGGSESNVAIALARLGVPVTWIGKVGSDPLGDLVASQIASEGVQLRVIRDLDAPTGLMIKERRTADQTRVWYHRRGSAGSRLRCDEVDFDLIRNAALLHVTGISLALSPEMVEVVDRAVTVACDNGVLVSFDLNYRSKLWGKEEAGIAYRHMIPRADIVFAGEGEAGIALGNTGEGDPFALAAGLASCGAREAVIKRGALGAISAVGGDLFQQAAIPIIPVDTVGAGDAFVAGYLSELLRDEPPAARLRTAAATGAYACLTDGDWEGLPTRDELGALFHTEPITR
jgi:2-dehydro-3-deoxygluconokinase